MRRTIDFVSEAWDLVMAMPKPVDLIDEILEFTALNGRYAMGKAWLGDRTVPRVWWAFFKDSPIAKFASLVAHFPATNRLCLRSCPPAAQVFGDGSLIPTGCVERLWSHMGYLIEGRERLKIEKLVEEANVKYRGSTEYDTFQIIQCPPQNFHLLSAAFPPSVE